MPSLIHIQKKEQATTNGGNDVMWLGENLYDEIVVRVRVKMRADPLFYRFVC